MNGFMLLLGIGLVVCAVLVRRHGQRLAVQPAPLALGAPSPRPAGAWPGGIARPPATAARAETEARAWQILRAEELRQRPWEGHN